VNRPVLLIDAYNLFCRSYAANPQMANGEHVGGTMGFLSSFGSIISILRPSACIIVWEGGGSARKRAIFPDYKGGRKPQRFNRFYEGEIPDTKENMNWQLKLLISLLKFTPVRQMYVSDCEADDVIGYIARYCFKEKDIVIVSSDHDYYQLISKRVNVWSPNQKKLIDENSIVEKYGILPINFCLARCFDGDVSDSIPGVPGVGLKTLAKKFPKLSSEEVELDEILNESRELSKNSKLKMYKSITESEDLLKMNWRLMNLDLTSLSATQVKKIEDGIRVEIPQSNKIGLMRTLMQNGVKTFNVDSLFLQINANLVDKQ
jgi:DNA polymerase-1